MPPEELRWRATGLRDAESFLGSAAVDAGFFEKEALGREHKSFRDFGSILDFGCGCGRLIRTLRPLCDQWVSLHGTDIDRDAIQWCKDNIADATFFLNGENPPLPFAEKTFDLIYACSVFSHLDADHQFRWLGELQRIMKPGGYLLLTFRSELNADRIEDAAVRERVRRDLNSQVMAFMPSDTWKDAFPAWYGEAYHTADYIWKNWGSYFEVVRIIPARTIGQETAVLRARESTFLQRLFQRH